MPIAPQVQVDAIRALLEKVKDPSLRRKVAQAMLTELEKDEVAAAEKLLARAMRGDAGVAAIQHLDYLQSLEPAASALREVILQATLPSAVAANAQNSTGLRPRVLG